MKAKPPKKMTEAEQREQARKNSKAIRGDSAVCAHCGAVFAQSDLGLLAQGIMQKKPACSYACNKALGQVM